MLRHIVFFSAKPGVAPEEIRDGLLQLAAIPGATSFEVVLNTKQDLFANEVDVVVYAEFPDAETLAAYKAHPVYAECVQVVKPLRELRFSVDIPAGSSRGGGKEN